MIGDDAHRRLIAESSAVNPIGTADEHHKPPAQAAEVPSMPPTWRKQQKQSREGGVYRCGARGRSTKAKSCLDGDREREKKKDKQATIKGTKQTQFRQIAASAHRRWPSRHDSGSRGHRADVNSFVAL